jgi:xanthine dehydrogenase YagS FAD-binding subunit
MTPDAVLTDVITELGRGGELRAGGTDVVARGRTGRASGPFVDLAGIEALRGIEWRDDGSARIGALTTVAEIAADGRLRESYPALTATAAGLATPQIRAAGTLGGNLLQRNRCWYYRNPRFTCHQTGGDGCPARVGLHLYSAVVVQGPCVAPHPSSVAVALLAYDATVEVHGRDPMPVAGLYGDGSDPGRDHLLGPAEVLTAVELPPPSAGERAAYHRAIGRAEAEWPLVEAVARLVVDDAGTVTGIGVAAGGVAHTPLRLPEVEDTLRGTVISHDGLLAAAAAVTGRCTPLPQTRYKVDLFRDTVLEVLERAAGDACDIPDHARRAD